VEVKELAANVGEIVLNVPPPVTGVFESVKLVGSAYTVTLPTRGMIVHVKEPESETTELVQEKREVKSGVAMTVTVREVKVLAETITDPVCEAKDGAV